MSTRFPGKPLVPLLGKPMVLWVAEACSRAMGRDQVVIATDDERIAAVASDAQFHVEITSAEAATGTDRVAEVVAKLGGQTVLNVQGDEPLVSPEDIRAIAEFHATHPQFVVNGYTPVSTSEDARRLTIPKVVLDLSENLLYASRAAIPGSKSTSLSSDITFLKQVCIYAYTPSQLAAFSARCEKTPLEASEDIEILRFLEMGQAVRMVKTEVSSFAVDEPQDVKQAERLMRKMGRRAINFPRTPSNIAGET